MEVDSSFRWNDEGIEAGMTERILDSIRQLADRWDDNMGMRG